MMSLYRVGILMAAMFLWLPASGYSQVTGPEVKVDYFHLDIVMESDSPQSILLTKEGKAIANSLGSYFGIPPVITASAVGMLKEEKKKGEETFVTFTFGEPGNATDRTHKYCGLAVQNLSINKPGKAHFQLDVHDHAIGIYAVTPKQRIGQGRSWVEANIEVVSVRGDKWEDLVKQGKCNIAMDRTLAACKGPDCPVIRDGPMYK
ncbi:MAG: hypothetical protein KF747_16440 [Nitrospira sp.]|nr:hypothetical protein [Nitrospira sp.]